MAKKDCLWQIACEGHRDAWVIAPDFVSATVEAAKFWQVPWGKVASLCEVKRKQDQAPRNICCECGKMYHGKPPMCEACRKVAETEEEQNALRLGRAYRTGKVI